MKRKDRSKGKEEADEFSDSAERVRHEEAVARERRQRALVEEEIQRREREVELPPTLEELPPRLEEVPSPPKTQRRVEQQRMPGCNLQVRWPRLGASTQRLQYIGPLFERRWRQNGVVTLRDLVREVSNHSLAQNRRMFERVFRNPRRKQCVPQGNARTKHWGNPWPDPPFNNVGNRDGLVAGHYTYCVRKWNRCGWESVEAFLRQHLNAKRAALIPPAPQRDSYCRRNQPRWCLEREEESEEESVHFKQRSSESNVEREGERESERQSEGERESAEEDDDSQPVPPVPPVAPVVRRLSIVDYVNAQRPQIFNPHQIEAHFKRRFASAFEILRIHDLAVKIAIILWFLKKDAPQRKKIDASEVYRLLSGINDKTLLALKHSNFRVERNEKTKKITLVPIKLASDEEALMVQLNIHTRLGMRGQTIEMIDLSGMSGASSQRGGSRRRRPKVTYYADVDDEASAFESRQSFGKAIEVILADQRGLGRRAQYVAVENRASADILISLTPQNKINKKCSFSNLSCSIISFDTKRPDQIFISLENWLGRSKYPGELADYRVYIINHEFLHCRPFHLDHPTAAEIAQYCGESRPIPVMYQQSNGLPAGKCHLNNWPLEQDFRRTFRAKEF